VAIRASKLGLAFGPKIMGALVFLARVKCPLTRKH
jgi:hypothetical protein